MLAHLNGLDLPLGACAFEYNFLGGQIRISLLPTLGVYLKYVDCQSKQVTHDMLTSYWEKSCSEAHLLDFL